MGPQFQADLNILHLSRHCDKSKWSRRPGVLSRDSGNRQHLSKLLFAVAGGVHQP